jgi:ParB family chromosome partitioning protein
MLGKGLESLIPQKGDGNSDDINAQPPASLPVDQETPLVLETEPAGPVPISEAPSVARPIELSRPATPAPTVLGETKKIDKEPREVESVFHIEVEKIVPNPDQPRRHFDDAALRDLAHSIREFGFLQPLVVTKKEKETANGIDVEYELIAGERRLLAAKLLGLIVVPAIIRKVSLEREKLELAVIENIQRENLNPIETARAFQRLQEEFRMTQREIAAKLGKSREVVANAMRLLDLPEYIRVAVEKAEMSESNARFLIAIEDPSAQKHLFEDILQNKLTTRDVKERVQQMGGNGAGGARRGRPPKSEQHLAPELRAMQDSLSSDLGAPVEIQKNANNGKITITFYSEEELANIMRRLGKEF